MAKVRVGIVGSGFMGNTWAEVVSRYIPRARLVGVAGGTRSQDLATRYEAEYHETVAGLLKSSVDVVVVATPQPTHYEYVLDAVAEGLHVLVEKPMAMDTEEAGLMVAAAASSDVRLGVVSHHRFRNSPRMAFEILRAGEIGELRMINVRGTTTPWAVPLANEPFADFGAHLCDLLRWFVGAQASEVAAMVSTYDATEPPRQNAMVVMRFPPDILVDLWFSYQIPQPGLGSMVQITMVGSEGIVDLDSYGAVRLGRNGQWTTRYEQPGFDPDDAMSPIRLEAYVRQMEDFVGAVEFGNPPMVDGHQGRDTMALLDATLRSGSSGSFVAPE